MHSKFILAAFSAILTAASAARPRCDGSTVARLARNGTAASSSGFRPLRLSKRIFEPWPDSEEDRDTFMVDQVGQAQGIVPPRVNDADINSAIYRDVGGDTAFSLGYEGLIGCTSLIVMSDEGVYFTHFWETLSFEKDGDFKEQVIDFLQKGRKENPEVQQSLAAHSDKFRDVQGLTAWVVWPEPDEDADTGEKLDYTSKIDNLIFTVNSIIGTAPVSVNYKPMVDITDKAIGRALYQYDPNAQDDENLKKGYRWIREYSRAVNRFFK